MKVRSGIRRCFKVKHPFKITLATLESTSDVSSSDVVTLWYQALAEDKLLLCTLGPAHPQQALHLYFFAHDVVTLYTCGHGTVNLLGYACVRRTSSTSLAQFSSSSEQIVPVNLSEDDDTSNDVWYPNEVSSTASAGVGDGKRYRNLKAVKSKNKTKSTGGDESRSSTSLSAESDGEESYEDIPEKSETAVGQGQNQKGSKTDKHGSVKSGFAAEKLKTRKTTSTKVKSKTSRGISAK